MGELSEINNSSMSTNSFEKTWRPIFAELVGTTLFVFVGCMVPVGIELSAIALAHGLMIALLIIGLGSISGGHFNPCVTLGVTLGGALSPVLAVGYVIGQLVGGVLGAALVRGTMPPHDYKAIGGGTHQLGPTVEPGWAILIEAILTTILVFTVLMAAVNEKTKSPIAPLAIGFAVVADILAGGPLTGASMNPARAFGPAVCSSAVFDDAWKYHYIYWVGPIIGSLIAVLLYRFLFAPPSVRWIARQSYEPM